MADEVMKQLLGEQRTRVIVASIAQTQLVAAVELIRRAQDNLKALQLAPQVLEHATKARYETEIAITQITTFIKRLP